MVPGTAVEPDHVHEQPSEAVAAILVDDHA
jgi:hypothetical protein